MILRSTAVGCLAVALLAGCGTGSDQDKSKSSIQGYSGTFADGDRACSHLSGDGRRKLLTMLGDRPPELGVASCDSLASFTDLLGENERAQMKNLDVVDIRIEGATATAYPALDGQKANR